CHWKFWLDGIRSHVFVVSSAGGEARDLTPGDYDAPPFSLGGPTDYAFSPDSKEIAFASNHDKVEATSTNSDIWTVSIRGGAAKKVVADGFNGDLNVTTDGRTLVFSRSSMTRAGEVYRANADGSGVGALTKTNEALLAPFNLKPAEEVTWTGAAGAKVAGWIVKPANFNARRKYPLVVLIHGGPQGAWNDNWGYRWNPQVFANAGYVAFMPNPRGSTGYGQQFVADISGDCGGKVFTDVSK